MVTVDYHSSFFEIDQLHSKTATAVLAKLKPHLARHGIPDQLMSDNGPPFDSQKFREFAQQHGLEHLTSSPSI